MLFRDKKIFIGIISFICITFLLCFRVFATVATMNDYNVANDGDALELIPNKNINTTQVTSDSYRWPQTGYMDLDMFSSFYCESGSVTGKSYAGYYPTITIALKDSTGAVLGYIVRNTNGDPTNSTLTLTTINTDDISTDKQVYIEASYNTGSSGGYAYKASVGRVFGVKQTKTILDVLEITTDQFDELRRTLFKKNYSGKGWYKCR